MGGIADGAVDIPQAYSAFVAAAAGDRTRLVDRDEALQIYPLFTIARVSNGKARLRRVPNVADSPTLPPDEHDERCRRTYPLFDDGGAGLDVCDEVFPGIPGRWGAASDRLERTSTVPHIALSAGALGSVFLGATAFRRLTDNLVVRACDDAPVERADALLQRPRAPWCPEMF